MAVAKAVSTAGKFKTFSSSGTTLSTVISDVVNELEKNEITITNTQFVFSIDGAATPIFTLIAICKIH